MSVIAWLVLVAVAYPLIAGTVFRARGGPRPCAGPHSERSGDCVGPWSIIWDNYACPDCKAHHRATQAAWLWPIYGLLLIPRRLFWLGHDVRAASSPAKEKGTPKKAGKP